jgi:hypothetical protein
VFPKLLPLWWEKAKTIRYSMCRGDVFPLLPWREKVGMRGGRLLWTLG